MKIHVGDKIHVRCDRRSYMECTIERIEDGIAHCHVSWSVIIASSYRCHVDQVEWIGGRWVRNHGISEQANVNAERF